MALLKRSLSVDQNDDRALRDIDHEALAGDGRSPVGLAVPFFFTREAATLPLVGAFRNSAAFLIGGGPSLRELDLTKIAGT